MKVIVTGGIYPRNWKEIQKKKCENFIRFKEGRILLIDYESKEIEKIISYISPPEVRNPSMMFKGAEICNGRVNVVTNSEIITYLPDTWKIERQITHPSFNDLHGVREEDGLFWVVNTGFETIQRCDVNGMIVWERSLGSVPTWERFSKDVDYRKIGSTKPHEIHINHIFKIKEEYYVTRMLRKDAIGLDDPSKRFEVSVGHPHDGICYGDYVYFTTTNGHIVIFSQVTRKREAVVNLTEAMLHAGIEPEGWCRGILPLSEDRALVGFTQLRDTKFKEFASWIKNLGKALMPTRLVEFDLSNKVAVSEFRLPGHESMAIFSLLAID